LRTKKTPLVGMGVGPSRHEAEKKEGASQGKKLVLGRQIDAIKKWEVSSCTASERGPTMSEAKSKEGGRSNALKGGTKEKGGISGRPSGHLNGGSRRYLRIDIVAAKRKRGKMGN